MTDTAPKIRFRSTLLRPASPKGATWAFLILPESASASARLPTRSMTSVEGTIAGHPFRATLAPDGKRSHWLKVTRGWLEATGAAVGDEVALEIVPAAKEPEPRVPADLKRTFATQPSARKSWSDLTPISRRDWIHWITSAKRPETRARRISSACEMLASGKRRVCCFDRSGIYSKGLGAPRAMD